jgi:hypothetical protein
MYDEGVTTIFDGGNSMSDSAFTAKWNYDYDLNVITAGENNKNAYTTIVKNYGEAIKDALTDFKGGTIELADCSTDGIYATFVSDDEDKQSQFDAVYQALANGEFSLPSVQGGAGYDFCQLYNEQTPYNCLTLNAWFLEGVQITQQ